MLVTKSPMGIEAVGYKVGLNGNKGGKAKKRDLIGLFTIFCAQEQIRTAMPIQAPPPQDGASTNFATWAF